MFLRLSRPMIHYPPCGVVALLITASWFTTRAILYSLFTPANLFFELLVFLGVVKLSEKDILFEHSPNTNILHAQQSL